MSPASPLTCGITATPVSNPDRPSASFGNTSSAMPIIASGLLCSTDNALDQSTTRPGCSNKWIRPVTTTTKFRTR